MSSFAGGDAMNRRRRMMTAEQRAESDSILGEFGIHFSASEDASPRSGIACNRLLHRLISDRLWKHFCLIIPASILLIVVASVSPDRAAVSPSMSSSLTGTVDTAATDKGAADDRPGLSLREPTVKGHSIAGRDSLRLDSRRLLDGFAGVMLILSGQFCLVTGLVRSRSNLDFAGRYRSWRWFGIALIAAGLLGATGLYPQLPNLTASVLQPFIGEVRAARSAVVLVSLTAFSIGVFCRIVPDMRRHQTARFMLAISVLVGTICSVAGYAQTEGFEDTRIMGVSAAVATSLMFAACLLHCRFVIHVSNDPPVMESPAKKLPPAAFVAEQQTEISVAAPATHLSPPLPITSNAPVVSVPLASKQK